MKTAVGLFWLILAYFWLISGLKLPYNHEKNDPPDYSVTGECSPGALVIGREPFVVGLNESYQTPDKTNMGMHIACVNPQNAFKL